MLAARGTLINGVFLIGVNTLALIRGFLVAAFLSTTEYGVWGVVFVILATAQFLKAVGVGDKFVQQDDDDQELAFQKAMSLEIAFSAGVFVATGLLVPVLALVLGEWEVILPCLVGLLVIPAQALQSPLWIFYRELDFAKQRKLQAVDPIVGFVLAVGLLVAGADYWALIVGVVAGAWAGAAVSMRASPFPLRLVFDRGTAFTYAKFSWPIFMAGLVVIVIGQGLLIIGEAELGLAGIGVIALTAQISQYADRADQAVTQTIYPTICAVKDRADLLFESFVKSNRLALMWGAPFGIGLALFSRELVDFVLGQEWRPAIGLMQAVGISVAVHQIGFNWDAFYRARDDTRPIAVAAAVAILTFFAITTPLLITDGLKGLALATLLVEGCNLLVRAYYLQKLFDSLRIVQHALRSLLPSVPAVAAVLIVRETLGHPDSLGMAMLLFALYVTLTLVATAFVERRLVREILGYVRGRSAAGAAA